MDTLFTELKRYVGWNTDDEAALRGLAPHVAPELDRVVNDCYQRAFFRPDGTRLEAVVEGDEKRRKQSLTAWVQALLLGPWDEDYYDRRARIGRVRVRIGLPQHSMFGGLTVLYCDLKEVVGRAYENDEAGRERASVALTKVLDLELAILLHTYREDLVAQRARNERLATFGQLVGSIGHELRNPLGVIESSLYILRGRIQDDERALKHVRRIGEQLQIANNIITDLLDMIRERPLTRERVELAPLIESILGVTNKPDGVTIGTAGLERLPAIDADASKLRQVLVNLVDNAVHAVGEVGMVTITGRPGTADIELAVEDTGPGVVPEVRARLFEPLITNKIRGIGLGLALVRRIVEQHGGAISYEPPAKGGARFVVRLPIGERHA